MSRYKGKGVTLTIAGTAIGQVVHIGPPQLTRGTVEFTEIDANWRQHLDTVLDGGDGEILLNWDTDDGSGINHANLRAKFITGGSYEFKITFPTGPTLDVETFDAILTAFEPETYTVDSVRRVRVGFKVTDDVVIAAT